MKVKIIKEENIVKLDVDGNEMNFDFDSIDKLIDKFVIIENKDFEVECEDETLQNYKELISNIYNETKNIEFVNAYNELNKSELTNEEIISLIEKDSSNNK